MAAFFQSPPSLSKKDFTLFHRLFCQEVDLLLPVSGAVFFWESDGNWLSKERAVEMLGQELERLPVLCASLEPSVIDKVIVLPVAVMDGDNIAVIIGEVDFGLLQKMASEWLQELRDKVQHALIQAKQAYMYPETGLYSGRLLNYLWNGFEEKSGALFLIGTPDRTRRSTRGLMKIMQTAYLLEASISSPVFYFGGNVFGVYQENIARDSGLHFARGLLGRLKREGLYHVHIGIALVQEREEESPDRTLKDCWEALETAEQRGPFSLCEASFLHNRHIHPLAQPAREIVRKLQNKWRGLKRFCLLLVRVEGADEKENGEGLPLAQRVKDAFQDTYFFVPVNSRECYLLLPGVSAKKALPVARKIKDRLDGALQPAQVAIGLSYWPCQDFFRTASIVNCRKSLMHGDFFGPGSVTLFDHVSLNVSGDYFFDEGDYRQAVRDYRAGLKINPDEVNLLNSLGVALTELNRLTEAVHYFDLVLEKEPNNFMALVNKGLALRMLKKEQEALACLSAAERCKEFSSSPVSADILLQLGQLYFARGQHKQAIRVLEKMKSRNVEKTGYLLFNLLGGAYAATGKNVKAITMLQEAIRYNPHDARSLSILGDLYGVEGQGDDIALSLCTQAVNIDDFSWDNWYRLAKVRFMVADYDGAQAAVRESLLRNRKAADAIFLAGKIFTKHGNKKQAKKMFQQVLRTAPDYPGASRALREIR
jgi:tetratricopeptide (TPR) repeat protein